MSKLRLLSLLFGSFLVAAAASAATLVGVVENVDEQGVVTGWAYDKDDPKQNVEIHFYAGPLTTPVGQVVADNSHPVPGSGPHWFVYKLPEQLRPAHGANTLYAYAVAPGDKGAPVQLFRSGTTTPYVYADLSKSGAQGK